MAHGRMTSMGGGQLSKLVEVPRLPSTPHLVTLAIQIHFLSTRSTRVEGFGEKIESSRVFDDIPRVDLRRAEGQHVDRR